MNYLAIDLGAESGRVILGSLQDERIRLDEIHRVPNRVIRTGSSMIWDTTSLLLGIDEGLQKLRQKNILIHSVSADSWGVDYILLRRPITDFDYGSSKRDFTLKGDEDISFAFHYRDPRTAQGVKELLSKVSWESIFAETGVQFMPINTLFQLASEEPRRINEAKRLLSHADYLNFLLGGEARIEESMASTFQMYNPNSKDWSPLLLEKLGIFRDLLGDVIPSGTVLGDCRDFPGANVVATCSHDTGCAVAAVPAEGSNWAYLSSGTWSLMGVELPEPIIDDKSRELNFTNEIGYGGSIRLLKNISGMWLLQECRRAWAEGGENFDYGELTRLAEVEPACDSRIDPMEQRFLAPANMPQAIAEFCREQGRAVPTTAGQFTRCIFESLADLYAKTLRQLEDLTGQKIDRLHIVGGGSKNAFLNQLTANACGIPVHAGPVEATALGNIIIQAITAGEIQSLKAARALIAANFPPKIFAPV
jgi:rhamnulokinase